MIWNIEDCACVFVAKQSCFSELIWLRVLDNAPKSFTPATAWEGKLKDITWSFDDDSVRFRHEQWREVFEKQLESTPLSIQSADPMFSLPLGEESFQWTRTLSQAALWDRYHTLSQFAVLEGDELLVGAWHFQVP